MISYALGARQLLVYEPVMVTLKTSLRELRDEHGLGHSRETFRGKLPRRLTCAGFSRRLFAPPPTVYDTSDIYDPTGVSTASSR